MLGFVTNIKQVEGLYAEIFAGIISTESSIKNRLVLTFVSNESLVGHNYIALCDWQLFLAEF